MNTTQWFRPRISFWFLFCYSQTRPDQVTLTDSAHLAPAERTWLHMTVWGPLGFVFGFWFLIQIPVQVPVLVPSLVPTPVLVPVLVSCGSTTGPGSGFHAPQTCALRPQTSFSSLCSTHNNFLLLWILWKITKFSRNQNCGFVPWKPEPRSLGNNQTRRNVNGQTVTFTAEWRKSVCSLIHAWFDNEMKVVTLIFMTRRTCYF